MIFEQTDEFMKLARSEAPPTHHHPVRQLSDIFSYSYGHFILIIFKFFKAHLCYHIIYFFPLSLCTSDNRIHKYQVLEKNISVVNKIIYLWGSFTFVIIIHNLKIVLLKQETAINLLILIPYSEKLAFRKLSKYKKKSGLLINPRNLILKYF